MLKTKQMATIITINNSMDFEPMSIDLPPNLIAQSKAHVEMSEDETDNDNEIFALTELDKWLPINITIKYHKKFDKDVVFDKLVMTCHDDNFRFLIVQHEGFQYKLSDVALIGFNVTDDNSGHLENKIETEISAEGIKFKLVRTIVQDDYEENSEEQMITFQVKGKITDIQQLQKKKTNN